MKRSNQVMLTAIFLTAVSAATARGQEVKKETTDDIYQNDNSNNHSRDSLDGQPGHHGYHTNLAVHGRHRGFSHIFGHSHNHNAHLPTGHAVATHTPRTKGFGTTMYKSPSSAHS